MKFLKSLHYTPPLMSVSVDASAQWPAQEAIITDEAIEQIATKVAKKIKSLAALLGGTHQQHFSDQLSVIQEKVTLGQCFYTLAKFGLGVKYCTINQEASPGDAVETHLQITFIHDPTDEKSVQSIASLVSWASSHGKIT